MPGQFSSTAQDLMRGRRSEIDHLNGYIVRRGKSLGIDTPANQALYSIVKLLERGEQSAKFHANIAPGMKLHFLIQGAGRPIVFTSGIGNTSSVWTDIVRS